MPGLVEAWDIFVQMGMTDDSYEMNVSYDIMIFSF